MKCDECDNEHKHLIKINVYKSSLRRFISKHESEYLYICRALCDNHLEIMTHKTNLKFTIFDGLVFPPVDGGHMCDHPKCSFSAVCFYSFGIDIKIHKFCGFHACDFKTKLMAVIDRETYNKFYISQLIES